MAFLAQESAIGLSCRSSSSVLFDYRFEFVRRDGSRREAENRRFFARKLDVR